MTSRRMSCHDGIPVDGPVPDRGGRTSHAAARTAAGRGSAPPTLPSCRLRRMRGSRSEEHTSELQSLMRISYAVFCLKKKNKHTNDITIRLTTTIKMKQRSNNG